MAMTRFWSVLQHVAWEGSGLVAAEAEARGLGMDIRCLDLEASTPHWDEVAGLVVMGGPMGAYETDKHPFLAGECSSTLNRDSNTLSAWRQHLPAALTDGPGQRFDAIERVGRRLIARFFDLALDVQIIGRKKMQSPSGLIAGKNHSQY